MYINSLVIVLFTINILPNSICGKRKMYNNLVASEIYSVYFVNILE